MVKTQAMRASPFIKPLEAAARGWEKLLLAAQVRAGLQGMALWPCKYPGAVNNCCYKLSWQQLHAL